VCVIAPERILKFQSGVESFAGAPAGFTQRQVSDLPGKTAKTLREIE
jgi:hypothetical protein